MKRKDLRFLGVLLDGLTLAARRQLYAGASPVWNERSASKFMITWHVGMHSTSDGMDQFLSSHA